MPIARSFFFLSEAGVIAGCGMDVEISTMLVKNEKSIKRGDARIENTILLRFLYRSKLISWGSTVKNGDA